MSGVLLQLSLLPVLFQPHYAVWMWCSWKAAALNATL